MSILEEAYTLAGGTRTPRHRGVELPALRP